MGACGVEAVRGVFQGCLYGDLWSAGVVRAGLFSWWSGFSTLGCGGGALGAGSGVRFSNWI